MINGISKIYALSVCFTSLICGSIATGLFLFNFVKVLVPESTIDPTILDKFSSVESYRETLNVSWPAGIPGALSNRPPLEFSQGVTIVTPNVVDEKEIDVLRKKELNRALSHHSLRAKQDMILQGIAIFICSALFVIHRKISNQYDVERT